MRHISCILALLLFITGELCAQIQIGGEVKDISGNPIPGVNVLLKGTNQGTITDIDGNYTLANIPDKGILVFSFMGMLTQEIPVGSETQINVTMEEDILGLDEVVVIGYGTVKKRDLTGSVASVKTGDIVKAPTHNALEAIQGKVPGIDIIRESGSAGSNVKLTLRGNRSIGDPENFEDLNKPLIIIDGVQGGKLEDLNANDIESIEVLKDASATAIYGYQGANGVILITTKKGVSGKTKISYNGYFGVNGLTEYPKVRLKEDYIQLRKDAYTTAGLWDDSIHGPENYDIIFSDAEEYAAVDSGQWVDWQDLLIRNGTQQSHQVSFSSGNEKTLSYFSVGYFKEEGIFKNDDMTRYNARLNIDHTVNKWFNTGLQSQVAYFDQNRRKDPLSKATTITPLGTPYNEDGSINLNPVAGSSTAISPLTDERPNASIDNELRTDVTAQGYIKLTPFKGFSFRSNLGTNLQYSRRGKFNDEYSLTQQSIRRNKSSMESKNYRYINWDNIITYSKELGDHSFEITALTSYTQSDWDNMQAAGYDQLDARQLFYNLGSNAVDEREISSEYEGSKTMSYAGRLHYKFKGKYLLTLTERLDGSSRLAPGNQWDHFPSVAGAWRISDEAFLKDNLILSNLKLRLSYGITGNSAVQPYSTQSTVTYKPIGFGDVPAQAYIYHLTEDLIGNDQLGWEKSATTNIGLDIALFKNRLSTSIDVYQTKTTDILLGRSLPQFTGVGRIYQNIGSTENKGIELAMSSVNVHTKDFKWTSALTYASNKEKITGLIDGQDIITDERNALLIGKPIQSYYTYKKLGIWQLGEGEEMDIYTNVNYSPGDIKVADLNNDSLITEEFDRTCIGSAVPKWIGGLENTFSYKSIELSVFLFARWGQMIYAEYVGRYNPSGAGNGPAYQDYWTPDNPSNDFPRPNRGTQLNSYIGYQSLSFIDGSYFKVKNIRLGYTLPNSLTSKVMIERLKIYVTASNLLTISKSHLVGRYDPERGGSEKAPLSKQIVFGVNVDF